MLLRNNMRPALAYANAGEHASKNAAKDHAFMYDAGTSDTDDFGAFSSGASTNHSNGGAKRPRNTKKKSGGLKLPYVAVAVVAVVAVVLLVVLAVSFLGGSGKDIKYANNAFISYEDSDGIWRVAANGKILSDYEGDVELRVAADRSFAYIIETVDEGNGLVSKNISYTDGKDITEVAMGVADVLATATLEPGIVWLDNDNGVFRYTEKDGEEKLVRKQELEAIQNPYEGGKYTFCISADASTVAYNERKDDGNYRLCVYKDGTESTNYQRNLFATAISNDGSLIYTYLPKDGGITKSLYVVPYKDNNNTALHALLTDNFGRIIAMNTKGDELVVTTNVDVATTTSLITFDPKKPEDPAVITRIGKDAEFLPRAADTKIACFATFADKYFEAQPTVDNLTGSVYYLSKKLETARVAPAYGKFSPDGDYFYYIDSKDQLKQVDLSSKKFSDMTVAEDVEQFEITQKGNLYFLGEDTRLMYYTLAKDTAKRVADNVNNISMHTYSNTLYYTYIDTLALYCSEESTKSEVAEIEGSTDGVPYFVNADCRKTFVIFYDSDNEECKLLYTSNGKKFKSITSCTYIPGFVPPVVDIPEISDPGETDTSGTDTSEA